MINQTEPIDDNKDKRYTQGPSAGGDGSGGEYSEEIRTILTHGRDIINQKGKLSPGDIVYVKNKKEHGVVIGKFPDPITTKTREGTTRIEEAPLEKYIILTVWREEQDDNNPLSFRIRYSIPSDIELIERGPGRAGSEILDYCKNQCLFYPGCDELCALKDLFNGVRAKKKKE